MSASVEQNIPAVASSPKLLPVRTDLPNDASATPRSSTSTEIHQSPRSPFLQHLHHRFRKGSIASSSASSSDALSISSPTDSADKAESARAAKRFLVATIRNDWEWPNPAKEEREGLKQAAEKKDEVLASREPLGWRTREESQSDANMDSDGSGSGKRRKRDSDPYRFENPDAIAISLAENKAKRRRKIDEEMQWNEGLKLWSERRDAWTAAVPSAPLKQQPRQQQQSPSLSSPPEDAARTGDNADDSKKKPLLSIPNSISKTLHATKLHLGTSNSEATANEDKNEDASRPEPRQHSSSATNTPSVSSIPNSTSTIASSLEADANAPYLPIYPPLFPTSHTLRARIKPPAYPTIYSKVVLQSLTPNVPIPLTHMIGALVDGWKSEGNWPPQAAAAEAAAAVRQNRRASKNYSSAFGRWRREQDEKRRLRNVSTLGDPGAHGHGIIKDIIPVDEGDIERKGFRKSLSGAVRKVLGMHDGEHDVDGGLERMGVRFLDEQELEQEDEEMAATEKELIGIQGLMEEAKDVMNDNVVLNRGLVEDGT